uniref:Uncharacterized protein n=1 Tax=Oxyrrhis marina TaxID=2969 RepID=A0A7S4GQC0_OXYMA
MANEQIAAKAVVQMAVVEWAAREGFCSVDSPTKGDDRDACTTPGLSDDQGTDLESPSESEESPAEACPIFGVALAMYRPMRAPAPRICMSNMHTIVVVVSTADVACENVWPISRVRVCLRAVDTDQVWVFDADTMGWLASDFNNAGSAGTPLQLDVARWPQCHVAATADVTGKGGMRFHACAECFNGNEWQWSAWSGMLIVPCA